MLKKYSDLQEKQFLSQVYPESQDLFLFLKAASEDFVQLNKSLSKQFHCLFESGTPSCDLSDYDGILLVNRDVELMDSTLSFFAAALKEGYDFIYSDAAFGGMAETQLLYPDAPFKNFKTDFALISGALFQRISKELKDPSVSDLLSYGFSVSEKPHHINQILLNYRMPLTTDALFLSGRKHALIFCHEFTLTGAPLVLKESIEYLNNYQLFIMGPEKDTLTDAFLAKGIPVILDKNARKACDITSLAFSCDLVLANTIIMYDVVNMLSGSNVPVLWWLHDNETCYCKDIYFLDLASNIHIYCVSDYAQKCFLHYQPNVKTKLLSYGVKDFSNNSTGNASFFPSSKGKVFFSSIGSINAVKGTDLFCDAILKLPEKIRKQCIFYFAGNGNDKKAFTRLMGLCVRFPETVIYGGVIGRDQISSLYLQTDCVICSSRYDPLPTFVTEGWMFAKPCLCSKNTGSAAFVKEGQNGYVFDPENTDEFVSFICKIVKEKPFRKEKVHLCCRNTYLENFSPAVFQKHFLAAVAESVEE